jgi:hypothetical protein
MYTDAMRRAFHNIQAPPNFNISVIDNEHFLTLKLNEKLFLPLGHDEKIDAVKYITAVKKALEMEGAIVLVTREPLQ